MDAVTPVFQAHGITYSYNEISALHDLSLTIQKGERVALLGANGSGKSTLLRILDALYFPDAGAISFEGESLTEERLRDEAFAFRFRRSVALLFQNPDVQLFNPTVFDEVAFGPLQLRWSHAEIQKRTHEVLEMLGIASLKSRPPHHLSGGEKKKVALASVLILDPEVILLDEPTASLDPRSQTQIIDFLTTWGNGTKTIVTATHDLHMLEDIADRCLIFERGTIIASGSPREILQDQSLLVRSNLIHGHRHALAEQDLHAHPHLHRPSEV